MTGLLLSNQNVSKDIPFPTNVPPKNETDSLLFLQAPCFHTPGNYIQGWNVYLMILVWYAISILAELGRCCYRRKGRNRGDGQTNGILERDEGGQSEEDDATSFIQLVPVILTGLTAFTFLSMLSGRPAAYLSTVTSAHGVNWDYNGFSHCNKSRCRLFVNPEK
ncbi:hypothetical protein BDP81DRAFT_455308 [Colletotrichum phormii]|uniref:Uncharacterized protein n=1 Tax=Colletotrichum phormii TaxID=359342 RepID=A0AAI9ZDF6_9PEZI|nr:uncharacterized protein BDP81DRAFT_455308 [Colletotrichum phormii]KAK1622504.1 hypothetical protein BDP81DRAFT_455308 [Colletotrichum phormii]